MNDSNVSTTGVSGDADPPASKKARLDETENSQYVWQLCIAGIQSFSKMITYLYKYGAHEEVSRNEQERRTLYGASTFDAFFWSCNLPEIDRLRYAPELGKERI